MLGLAIALIVLTIIFAFTLPWVGIATGIVALVLFALYFAGFGRRAVRREGP